MGNSCNVDVCKAYAANENSIPLSSLLFSRMVAKDWLSQFVNLAQNLFSVYAYKSRQHELHNVFMCLSFIGVGKPLSVERTRMLLALRINILSKGFRYAHFDDLFDLLNV